MEIFENVYIDLLKRNKNIHFVRKCTLGELFYLETELHVTTNFRQIEFIFYFVSFSQATQA